MYLIPSDFSDVLLQISIQFKSRDLIIKILNSQNNTVGTAKHVLIIQLIIAYRLYQHD